MSSPSQLTLLASRLPMTEFVTVKELARAAGFSVQFILDSYDSGKVLGLAASGSQGGKKRGERLSIRIPREAAILWLLQHSNFSDEDFIQNLYGILDLLPRTLLLDIYSYVGKQLQK
jgi:hypothetical protein